MYGCINFCFSDIRNRFYEKGLLNDHEDIRMIVDNCALVEGCMGKNYTYRAVNVYTLESKHLFYRDIPIAVDKYNRVAEKILQLNINYFQDTSLIKTKSERARILITGIFNDILPRYGYLLRENQLGLSLEMLRGLQEGKLSLCEAEVGTGKTHAYIIAVTVHNLFSDRKMPTVISTSTIALQKALTEEYIPQISEILSKHRIIDKPLTFVVRKGKSHYVCDVRLRTYMSSIRNLNRHEDKILLDTLMVLTGVEKEKIDLDTYTMSRYVKDRVCVSSKCNDQCPYFASCRFMTFREACLSPAFDFQIANHNFVMANVLNMKSKRKRLLPDHKAVIFDEAHKIADTARQMYGSFLSDLEVPSLIAYIAPHKLKDRQIRLILTGHCDHILKYHQGIFNELARNIPTDMMAKDRSRYRVDFSTRCITAVKCLIKQLEVLAGIFIQSGNELLKSKFKNIHHSCNTIAQKLETVLKKDDIICWLELQKGGGYCLCSIPKNLNELLYKDIWDSGIPYILTSGTLSVGGCFSHIKQSIGIDLVPHGRILETSKPSPFDYKQNTLLYIPDYIPFPNIRDEAYIAAVVKEIEMLIKISCGHTLILFTSYSLMERVYNAVRLNVYEYPLFIMGKGRLDAISEFRISGNGVLFASDSCGEGIDIVGDVLSTLIIVKLPFAVPDPISEYEQTLYSSLREYLDNVNTPNMLIKLKQYAGRLIRSESDTGAIVILDSRVNRHGKYRSAVLEALFDTTVTNSIQDVWNFIVNRKNEEYFE